MNRTLFSIVGSIVLLSASLPACSSDDSTTSEGTANDASADTTPEASGDASTDVVPETSIEAATEASSDVMSEASADVVAETPADAPTETSDDATADASDDITADAAIEDSTDVVTDSSDDTTADASADASVLCPSCDELLTWDPTQMNNSSYGTMSTVSNWDDTYAWDMLQACPGWGIYEGHEGGIGNTLEIASCGDGLVLRWTYDQFTSIDVAPGWTGQTDKGVTMGTSYQAFVQAYPGYKSGSVPLDGSGYAFLVYEGGFATFGNGALTKLSVY